MENILKIAERLDLGNADVFKKEAVAVLDSPSPGLLVDFSETKFIDSIGLGALVSILKQSAQKRKRVVLANLSPQVRQIFELTRLYRLFEIFPNVEDAEAALAE
ncbi:MAG: STAS domain-containing protein [Kiritimatiellaeota bacterium]|nr:STAS domain-containing protein [Kiritimatiellota bacterium]